MDPSRSIKYGLDRVMAVLLLVLLSPLLLVIAVAIRLDSPGSPLFLQERTGAGGQPFTIFKFRTMRCGSEKLGLGATTAADDARITRMGRLLRAASLDELPQLLNIALGEMSFVGPRPTLRYQVDAYTPRQRRRLLFRPGITGWAQVHGRNEIPWAQRIEFDIEYIERHSLWLDLRILWRTLLVLLQRDGVYARGLTNDGFVPAPPSQAPGATAPVKTPVGSASLDAAQAAPPPPPLPPFAAAPLPLLIVGAGGHARVLIDIAEKQGRYRVVGLLDESPQLAGTRLLGYPVLGGREVLGRSDLPSHAIVAIGSPQHRRAWQEHLETLGLQMAVLVHPAAQVARDVHIGPGSVLMACAVVNPGSRLGRGVIVNTAASIDHDCDIGDFVHVAPGARLAGGVRVGAGSHIGIGACVVQELGIGAGSIVGAGAAVVRPVPAGVTVAGVPARLLARRAPQPAPIAVRS